MGDSELEGCNKEETSVIARQRVEVLKRELAEALEQQRTWTIPAVRFKSDRDELVMLSVPVIQLLDRIKRRQSENHGPFVFYGRVETDPGSQQGDGGIQEKDGRDLCREARQANETLGPGLLAMRVGTVVGISRRSRAAWPTGARGDSPTRSRPEVTGNEPHHFSMPRS